MYFIGTDLGQRRDPSAIAIAERREQILHGFDHLHWLPTAEKLPAEWIVRRLERIPLGTPYTNVVDRLAVIANHPQIRGNAWLVLDATRQSGARGGDACCSWVSRLLRARLRFEAWRKFGWQYVRYGSVMGTMSLAKRTYSLPPEVVAKFENRIAVGDRSSVLAQLIRS